MIENEIRLYAAPEGADLSKDYILKVRPVGRHTWKRVDLYRVKVDMHDVRKASMAFFDFTGAVEVEIEVPGFYRAYRVDIRPLSLGIRGSFSGNRVSFTLDKPVNISVEINRDRYHNLHLFAGTISGVPGDPDPENTLVLKPNEKGIGFVGDSLSKELETMPEGRTLYLSPGLYYVGESIWHLPSHTRLYLAGGAVLIGGLAIEHGEDIRIGGRGVICLSDFHRFSSINGIRISHSRDIIVEDLIFIDPPHYTVHLGGSRGVTLRRLKSFSCEGWSDGIDMMSCEKVVIEGCFLRTSDDCIAIYGSRWDYRGDTREVWVHNSVLWADVAHPVNIGIHGDHACEGDVLEQIVIEDIDVLEQNEYQEDCLGVMAINVGDKNTARQIEFRNIRVEPFLRGALIHFSVVQSPVYNPAPGKGIRDILVDGVQITSGSGEAVSKIFGYNTEYEIRGVTLRNICRDGKKIEDLKEVPLEVGPFAREIRLE